jgi:hypothetical protein
MWPRAVFDCGALYDALDAERSDDHPVCGGAVRRLRERETTSCHMTLVLRVPEWLGRPAAAFVHPARW